MSANKKDCSTLYIASTIEHVTNQYCQSDFHLCISHLFAGSNNWHSKWAGVSLFRLGVSIWPPRLNSLSTDALDISKTAS